MGGYLPDEIDRPTEVDIHHAVEGREVHHLDVRRRGAFRLAGEELRSVADPCAADYPADGFVGGGGPCDGFVDGGSEGGGGGYIRGEEGGGGAV